MTNGQLSGKRAVVVGGTTGIGQAIGLAWARAGADVVVCGRRPPTSADAGLLGWRRIDLAERDDARAELGRLAAGPVDLLCFSAVRYGRKRCAFGVAGEQEWHEQLAVNVTGLWLSLAAFLPRLREAAPGLVLGVSSEVAFNAGPGRSGYAASKAAAKALLDSVAQEEDPAQVRVVQVLPEGMVDTPGIRSRRSPGFDYSSYMSPDAFASVAVAMTDDRGAVHHGRSLVVGAGGDWWGEDERAPVSQSHR